MNELSKKTPLQYCVSNRKTVLERQIYNEEKSICEDCYAIKLMDSQAGIQMKSRNEIE